VKTTHPNRPHQTAYHRLIILLLLTHRLKHPLDPLGQTQMKVLIPTPLEIVHHPFQLARDFLGGAGFGLSEVRRTASVTVGVGVGVSTGTGGMRMSEFVLDLRFVRRVYILYQDLFPGSGETRINN
jgi:hypothetical protein